MGIFTSDQTKLIHCPTSKTGSYTIPITVTNLEYFSFENCSTLTSVIIPEGLTTISRVAFLGCSGLKTLTLPEGISVIEFQAFQSCTGLDSLILPSTLSDIHGFAFAYDSSLTSIINYSTSPVELGLDNEIFLGVNKTTCILKVPFGTKATYQQANQWQDFINIVEMPGLFLSSNYVGFGPNSSTKKLLVASSVPWTAVSDKEWLIINPTSSSSSDSLSFYVTENTGETRTAKVTISSTGLENQIINITQYGRLANIAGGLKNLLGDDISTITNLTITGTIDARDFKTMRDDMPLLEEIDLSGATIVSYSGSEGTSTGNISYPANSIPQYAFYNNSGKYSLNSIKLPTTLASIGTYSFAGCSNLSSIVIYEDLISIGEYAFWSCESLKNIELPVGLISISQSAFYYCTGLVSMSLPVGVTTIGASAFNNCNQLTTLSIPSTVTKIESGAFAYCNALQSIIVKWAMPLNISTSTNVFNGVDKTFCTLFIPLGTIALYSTANQWQDFTHIVESSNGCRTITSFPWNEGFEHGGSIPDCWDLQQVSSSGLDWIFISGNGSGHPAAAHGGTYNACLKDNTSADNKTKLISPAFNLNVISSPILTFWHTQQVWPSDQDKLIVYYKTSATGIWTQLASYTSSITSWTQETISLPNASPEYYICFEGNAKYGYGVCVDDVSITGIPPILQTLEIADTTIHNRETACFNAYQTITVAGGETSVVFQASSIVDVIAGNSIRFLPGFHAENGSNVHAVITPDSSFCVKNKSAIVEIPSFEISSENGIIVEDNSADLLNKSVKIYPNPSNGKFFVETSNFSKEIEIKVFNLSGKLLNRFKGTNGEPFEIALLGIQSGLYYVMVSDEKSFKASKIVIH